MVFLNRTEKVDLDNTINELDDTELKEHFRLCQGFLVDSELEKARHKVFKHSKDILNPKKLDKNISILPKPN